MIWIWDLNHWNQDFLALFVIPNPSQLHVGNILNEDAAYKRAVTGQNGNRKLLSHS